MGRPLRVAAGGLVYHVLNRASGRGALFEGVADYQQFEDVLADARSRVGMRILAYCVMPNHWHLVLWPERDDDLTRFMTWLSLTHTQRWHARRGTAGSGHVYQGRYKTFLVQTDEHLLTACRYVERNPLRARLVRRAERWRWGSLWRRERAEARRDDLLADWPVRARPTGVCSSTRRRVRLSWHSCAWRSTVGVRSANRHGSRPWRTGSASARRGGRAAVPSPAPDTFSLAKGS